MQATSSVSALLNPFAAAEAGGQAVGGLEGLLEGLFGAKDGTDQSASADAFSQALAAAMATPVQNPPVQTAPAANPEGAQTPEFVAPAAQPQSFATVEPLMTEAGTPAAQTEADGKIELPQTLADTAIETPRNAASDLKPALAAAREASASPVAPPPAAQPLETAPVAVASAAQPETPPQAQTQAQVQAAALATPAAKAAPAETNPKVATKAKAAQAESGTRGEARLAVGPQTPQPAFESADALPTPQDGARDADLASLPDAPHEDATVEAPVQQFAGHHEVRDAAPSSVETPRANTQTVAHLAAQITSKLDGKSTRFDVQLDPHGLGKVDVKVEIAANGSVSAALTFENPHAASELRGRQGELQAALEQAGFDLSKTSLSFNSGGQGQQGLFNQQQQQQAHTPVWRGRAFTSLSDTPETAPAPIRRRAATGVDVRI